VSHLRGLFAFEELRVVEAGGAFGVARERKEGA
jgi:hypothetical protein